LPRLRADVYPLPRFNFPAIDKNDLLTVSKLPAFAVLPVFWHPKLFREFMSGKSFSL
jgi:hypothetical protein